MPLRIPAMLGAAVAIALTWAGTVNAEPFKIRVGWVQTPGHLAPIIEALGKKHPEIFKHLGQSYVMQAVRFNGTTPQIQAIAINELEIGSQSSTALALSIANAKLPLRVVSDVLQDGHEGYFSQLFIVKADGGINKVEDIKGKRVATNAIGSASDSAMRAMFRQKGIKDTDFTTVETNFATMPAMIEGGKVDMIGVLPQFAKGIVGNDKYKTLFTARDAVGPTQSVMWAIRSETIQAHRAAFVDFFEDHIRAIHWLLDPANRKDAVALCAEVTKIPAEDLGYVFTKADFYRAPDARPEIALAQKEIDENVKLGVVPKPIQINPDYVDLSLIEDAKKQLDGGK